MTLLFPGTFDPFTIGHASLVERALPLCDRLIIAVGFNPAKSSAESVQERVKTISRLYADINRSISGIETILLYSLPELSFISSSMVRELASHGHDISQYLP